MLLWAGSPGRELACRWWKGGSWTQVSFLFGLGSVLSDFVALMGPSTNHPQTAGKSMNYGRGIIGLKRQNAILMGPCQSCAAEVKWFVQQGNQIKEHTPEARYLSPKLSSGHPHPLSLLRRPESPFLKGGFLLIPAFSYGAIYCSLSRILIFPKLHWVEHLYPLKAFLWPYPGKWWSTDLFCSWWQGCYGTSLLGDSCISSRQQKRAAPEAICFMVHFRINDLPSQFLTLHFS